MKKCICGLEMWMLDGTDYGVHVCRRCDTVPQPSGMRAGPPNSPGSRDGWFRDPFGDRK